MRYRWFLAILLLAGVLPVSLALAEHPKWAPMAPQPAKKSSHTSHAARYYRGRGTRTVRAANCAGMPAANSAGSPSAAARQLEKGD